MFVLNIASSWGTLSEIWAGILQGSFVGFLPPPLELQSFVSMYLYVDLFPFNLLNLS